MSSNETEEGIRTIYTDYPHEDAVKIQQRLHDLGNAITERLLAGEINQATYNQAVYYMNLLRKQYGLD